MENWQKREIKAETQPVPSSEELREKSLGRRLLKSDVIPKGRLLWYAISFHISLGKVAILNITLRFGNRDKNKKYCTTKLSFSPIFLRQVFTSLQVHDLMQRAKKVVSDSSGLVDFAIGPVDSVVNLPEGQVKSFRRIKITVLVEKRSLLDLPKGITQKLSIYNKKFWDSERISYHVHK